MYKVDGYTHFRLILQLMIKVIFYFRVHAYWTGNSVVSILSIKSAISEDTGNYSCILPNTGEKVTASLHILKGNCIF